MTILISLLHFICKNNILEGTVTYIFNKPSAIKMKTTVIFIKKSESEQHL